MKRYFVYGTLMSGMKRNTTMQFYASYVGDEKIYGYKMYDYVPPYGDEDNYPVIIFTGDEDDVVVGEIWESDIDDLDRVLDVIEGAPYLYTRESVFTDMGDATAYVGSNMWMGVLDKYPMMMEYPSGVKWKGRSFILGDE